MTSTQHTPPSKIGKTQQAQIAFDRLLADALRRGFYGTCGIVLNVQDGAIQQVRVSVDKVIR